MSIIDPSGIVTPERVTSFLTLLKRLCTGVSSLIISSIKFLYFTSPDISASILSGFCKSISIPLPKESVVVSFPPIFKSLTIDINSSVFNESPFSSI